MDSEKICSVAECGATAKIHGLCNSHYGKLYRYGDPLGAKQGGDVCAVGECKKLADGSNYCSTHNRRYKKHGDPLVVRGPGPQVLCKVDSCDTAARALGYCIKHYLQDKKTRTKCSIDGCNDGIASFGLCNKHYLRQKRHGSTDKVLHHAKQFFENVVLKYEGDECLMWPFPWSKFDYYPKIKYRLKSTKVHRAVCLEVYGPPPDGKPEVAHSCGRGIEGCCNPKHLRWASRAENIADRYGG
jgi:hypothetical protein